MSVGDVCMINVPKGSPLIEKAMEVGVSSSRPQSHSFVRILKEELEKEAVGKNLTRLYGKMDIPVGEIEGFGRGGIHIKDQRGIIPYDGLNSYAVAPNKG